MPIYQNTLPFKGHLSNTEVMTTKVEIHQYMDVKRRILFSIHSSLFEYKS